MWKMYIEFKPLHFESNTASLEISTDNFLKVSIIKVTETLEIHSQPHISLYAVLSNL